MKTGSKITLALGAVAAFLFAKKKGIAGIGKINRNNRMDFSPYKMQWIVLIPEKGIATRHDEKILSSHPFWFTRSGDNIALLRHCPDKNRANAIVGVLSDMNFELDKHYTAYIISDKQFGMIDARNGWTKDGVLSVVTTKQEQESVVI